MKRIWFIFCMALVCSFGLTACIASAETQAKIDALIIEKEQYAEKLVQAYEDHKARKLTTAQLAELSTGLKENVLQTKQELMALREEGVGWGDLIWSVVIGAASRGIPSKGPIGAIWDAITGRNRKGDPPR